MTNIPRYKLNSAWFVLRCKPDMRCACLFKPWATGLQTLAGVLLTLSLVACGMQSASNDAPLSAGANSALRAATEAELIAYIRDALGPSSVKSQSSPQAGLPVAAVTTAATTGTGTAPAMSGTTLQEVGVDEADLIKSDGSYIYSLDPAKTSGYLRDTVRRQKLDNKTGKAALLPVDSLTLPFSANVNGEGIYLDAANQQLAVVGAGYTYWGMYDMWFSPSSWGQGLTEVILLNTTDPTQMQTRRKLQMTGHLIGSRRINTTLYLVLRSYPEVKGLDLAWPTNKTASNQAVIDALQAPQVLPKLTIDGGSEQPLVQATDCYVQNQNALKSADIITIVAFDLASATPQHTARCFVGGTEAFYMSDQSLYLATTQTAYTLNNNSPVYAPSSSTDIHKFSLNGLAIAYRGSGNVQGHLGFVQNRKSFRMGEYAGALRVITQTAPTWGGWIGISPAVMPVMSTTVMPVIATTVAASPATTVTTIATAASATSATTTPESPGHLTILQENAGTLQKVGELPNTNRPAPLGKVGEQLYASRFLGTRGYLVTYRLTDPLYVLDLSNPTDPKIAGELQVDGYSDYLFPLDQNLLLGVGKDAKSDGSAGDGRFAWYQGVKVSLIDVSDPANPREAARAIIGKRGTDATVLHDHHGIALQTQGNTVRISLPMNINETAMPYTKGAASDYYGYTRTELQRFEVDLTAKSLTARPAAVDSNSSYRDISNDRSLLWNDQFYWYQNGAWSTGAW